MKTILLAAFLLAQSAYASASDSYELYENCKSAVSEMSGSELDVEGRTKAGKCIAYLSGLVVKMRCPI